MLPDAVFSATIGEDLRARAVPHYNYNYNSNVVHGQFDDAWCWIGEAMTRWKVETTKERASEAEVHRIAGEIAVMSRNGMRQKRRRIWGAR